MLIIYVNYRSFQYPMSAFFYKKNAEISQKLYFCDMDIENFIEFIVFFFKTKKKIDIYLYIMYLFYISYLLEY